MEEKNVTCPKEQDGTPDSRRNGNDIFVAPAAAPSITPRLNVWHLTGICFFAVAGGPFGFEDTINAAGSYYVYLSFLILPFLWSIPIALMTAELSTLILETGGHVKWVERGLGPSMGFANSMICLFTSLTDNALYPVMFANYFKELLGYKQMNWVAGWTMKVVLMMFCAATNIRGVDLVGDATISFAVLVMAPFFVMAIIGMTTTAVGEPDAPAVVDWGAFLTIMMWNTSGFDSAGTCAAEVKNPSKTYPQAVGMSLILVIATYLMPTWAALKVLPKSADWGESTWVVAAKLLGGGYLETWMGLAAVLSTIGILSTMLCTTSRLFYGVATSGYLPKFCTRLHPSWETPYVTIVLNAIISLAFSAMDFKMLAEVTTILYSSSTILRFLALWRLRCTEPDSPRPFVIPFGHFGMCATCVPPIALSLFAAANCKLVPKIITFFCLLLIASATVVHTWLRHRYPPNGGYAPLDSPRARGALSYVEISAWDSISPSAVEISSGSPISDSSRTKQLHNGNSSVAEASSEVANGLSPHSPRQRNSDAVRIAASDSKSSEAHQNASNDLIDVDLGASPAKDVQ